MKLLRWVAFSISLSALCLLSSCLGSSEVKIGVIVPREESNLADYGSQIDFGIRLAFKEVEALSKAGGLKKTYKLEWEAEKDDPEQVKESFMRLKNKKVSAIIGATSSAATLALTELTNKNKIVLLSPASSSPEINSGSGDFVFRNYPSDTLEAQKLSNIIFQKCRIQKVLMVRARNAFSEGITYEMLKFGRKGSNRIPNEVVKFDSDPNSVDYAAVADRIIEVNPEAVFLGAYTNQLIPLIQEIRTREELSNLYIFTCSAFVYEDAVNKLGKDAMEGIMFSAYHWDPQETKPEVSKFATTFENEFTVKPGIFAATGYDALWILVKAIEEVNHSLPDEIRSQLNNEVFYGVLGETDFNKRGDVTRIPLIYRITDGMKTPLRDEDIEKIKNDVLTRI